MAVSQNVRFIFGSLAKYQALETKDPMALYFLTDEETGKVYFYKGDQLYASDALASAIADGLMSKEDKAALDELIANQGNANLIPIDATINIADGKIGVQVSSMPGNLIEVKDDGLFVSIESISVDQISGLEDRLTAVEEAAEVFTWETL